MKNPIDEVNQLEGEIAQMQERLKELQIPHVKPTAEKYSSPTAVLQAQRQWQQLERDRLDEIEAIEACLPMAEAKLAEKLTGLNGLQMQDQKAIEEIKKLAAEVEKRHEAYAAALQGLKKNRTYAEGDIIQ